MKKSILVAFVATAVCTNVVFAIAPAQDKPVSKTTTTTSVKKSTPTKTKTATTSVHKKHVKTSE